MNNSCDIDIKLFNKSFEINQLKNTFIDIPLAYESILPIKGEKLIHTLLLLKHVKIHPQQKFFETLYSNEVAVTSKSKIKAWEQQSINTSFYWK